MASVRIYKTIATKYVARNLVSLGVGIKLICSQRGLRIQHSNIRYVKEVQALSLQRKRNVSYVEFHVVNKYEHGIPLGSKYPFKTLNSSY
jgi:hypothetical protein